MDPPQFCPPEHPPSRGYLDAGCQPAPHPQGLKRSLVRVKHSTGFPVTVPAPYFTPCGFGCTSSYGFSNHLRAPPPPRRPAPAMLLLSLVWDNVRRHITITTKVANALLFQQRADGSFKPWSRSRHSTLPHFQPHLHRICTCQILPSPPPSSSPLGVRI